MACPETMCAISQDSTVLSGHLSKEGKTSSSKGRWH